MPCVLAQCACNAHNALVLRHLSQAPNSTVVKLINPFLGPLKHPLRTAFKLALPDKYEGWRTGKRIAKLAGIDRSKALDHLRVGSAKSFVKLEVGTSLPKKARLIQGNYNEATAYENPDEYAAVGAALKEVGREIFLNQDGVICQFVYAGGLNHEELSGLLSQWWSERSEHFFFDERDGKNWDATMNQDLLWSEYLVYDMLKLKSASTFLQRSNGCVGSIRIRDGLRSVFVKYFTAWKRLSGDWNTSVGNSIVSMIIAYTVLHLLPPAVRPRRIRALFMGDDYLALLEFDRPVDKAVLLQALNQAESSCGITPERGLTTDPMKISFISLGVWPTRDGRLAFIPHPAKQLAKLFVTVKRVPDRLIASFRSEIARSFLPVYRGFDFMVRFLRYHLRPDLLNNPKILPYLGTHHLYKTQFLRPTDIDWKAGFVYKYGFPITALEWQPPPADGLLRHPAVDLMLTWESLDPCDRM